MKLARSNIGSNIRAGHRSSLVCRDRATLNRDRRRHGGVDYMGWYSIRIVLRVWMEGIMALESETVETLEAAALQLTPADRARLVDRLIATLDADPEVEEACATEVERRQTEIENGKVSILPGPETLTKLKAELNEPFSAPGGFGRPPGRCLILSRERWHQSFQFLSYAW